MENTIMKDAYLCNLEKRKLNELAIDKLHSFNHNTECKSGINTRLTLKSVDTMKSIFEAKWRQTLNNNGPVRQRKQLQTYFRFKQKFTFEIYLDFDNNYHKRHIITKIRCSEHRLEIETGRYNVNGITDVENRIC